MATSMVLVLFVVLTLLNVTACNSITKLFDKFINEFNKPYKKHSKTYYDKLAIFKENVEIQNELNKQRPHNNSARYGINQFSDMSNKEFQEMYLLPININNTVKVKMVNPDLHISAGGEKLSSFNIPLKVDWREKGVITPVLNQKSCGSCWAFAVTETIESEFAVRRSTLPKLSVQEMMDCSYDFAGALHGCNGGDTCSAFDWMQQTQTPLVADGAYPLTDKLQSCKVQASTAKGVKVRKYTCDNLTANEKNLLNEIAKAPVAVAVDASMWNNYLGGVIQFHCGETGINHAVQIVGYDVSAAIPYYIVKNSWGTNWGHKGYGYVKFGGNVCRIASRVSSVETYN